MKTMHTMIASLLTLAAFPVLAGELIDETREVSADAVIDIEIPNSIITLTGWDQNQFHIAGELSDQSEGYELREMNGGIRFREEIDRPNRWNWDWDDDARTSIEIQVPRNSVVRLEGINSELNASGVYGSLDVELVNGEVTLSDLRGTIQIETVNGDIEADGLDGRIELGTVNGDIDDLNSAGSRIELSTVNGNIRSNTRSTRIGAETVNGDIELALAALDELEASTVGGSVEVEAALNERAQIDISSVGGRIDLVVPATTSARFNVTTATGGRINNRLSDDQPERKNRYVNSQELDFVLNGGSGDVSISTVSGNVTLETP